MDHPLSVSFIRWIVLLPLVGATINCLLGAWIQKQLGQARDQRHRLRRGDRRVCDRLTGFSQMLALQPEQRFCSTTCGAGSMSAGCTLDIAFWLDPLSAVMMLVVTGVGGLIHIYSTGYMHDDESYWRFFAWLNLFTFAMLVLVLGDNLLLMFVGWEGVGLCSYALIGFWYKELCQRHRRQQGVHRQPRRRLGLHARAVPAVLGARWGGPSDLGDPRDRAVTRRCSTAIPVTSACRWWRFVTLLMFVGATGKSAQIPLYVWLPDAMAGPTPVSALIHAATMVTAGVYMIGAAQLPVFDGAGHAADRRHRWRVDRAFRRHHRHCSERHQEGAGLLDDQPARLHVHRHGRRRLRRRRLPPDDPRVLQGLPVSRLRQRDPRDGRRAGHAQDGRAAQAHAGDVRDLPGLDARDLRHPAVCRASSPRTKSSGRPSPTAIG